MSDLEAFAAEHVCRLTGLSARQLRYWDKTEFFSPTLLDDHRRRAFGRIYSFRDVVGLRTIAILRNEHRLPLQELRRVGEWLKERHDTPWASLRFALKGRTVAFIDPEFQVAVEAQGAGQQVLAVALEPIAREMSRATERLKERDGTQIGQLSRNRYVVHNAWVVSGTRIPTEAIWHFHEAGYSQKDIIAEYPRLTRRDITAAIEFERERRSAAQCTPTQVLLTMLLLIDENVPNSVAQVFSERGHDVRYVRDLLPGGTPDPVIATVGDRLSRQWSPGIERVLLERWIEMIEFHFNQAQDFHAHYGGDEATISITDLTVLAGRLHPRVMGLVMEWSAIHQPELEEAWIRATKLEPLGRIDPLQ